MDWLVVTIFLRQDAAPEIIKYKTQKQHKIQLKNTMSNTENYCNVDEGLPRSILYNSIKLRPT